MSKRKLDMYLDLEDDVKSPKTPILDELQEDLFVGEKHFSDALRSLNNGEIKDDCSSDFEFLWNDRNQCRYSENFHLRKTESGLGCCRVSSTERWTAGSFLKSLNTIVALYARTIDYIYDGYLKRYPVNIDRLAADITHLSTQISTAITNRTELLALLDDIKHLPLEIRNHIYFLAGDTLDLIYILLKDHAVGKNDDFIMDAQRFLVNVRTLI